MRQSIRERQEEAEENISALQCQKKKMEKKKRMHTLTQLSVINSHARERVFHKNNTTERATLQLLAGG